MQNFSRLVETFNTTSSLAIDISVFTRPYFLSVLRCLKEYMGIKQIDVVYTEPSSYLQSGQSKYEFSVGSYEAIEIPGYTGRRMARNKRLLVILLGFEEAPSRCIRDDIEPNVVVPVNGFPSYLLHYKDESILANKNLLGDNKVRALMKFAPANDPFETYNTLDEICRNYADHAVTIAPLGTKPMALGSAMYALRHHDVRISDALPRKYKYMTSMDWGTSWLFRIEF
jgi:hypothetical protein